MEEDAFELIERIRFLAAGLKLERDELLAVCKKLIDYRDRNTLNFQLVKADDFINEMRRLVDQIEGGGE